jgi:integrase
VSGKDSTGITRRKQFDANDFDQAVEEAHRILGLEYTTNHSINPNRIRISDALIMAASTRNRNDETSKKEKGYCRQFLKWIDSQNLHFWNELRYEHALRYKNDLKAQELAYDTVRLYMRPVQQTSSWMAKNWPGVFNDFSETVKVTKEEFCSTTYDESSGNPYLSIQQVLNFIDWLHNDTIRYRLILGVALQGLVGLSIKEMIRLTWHKINLDEGTITIDGFVKNPYRIRKIPVPTVVLKLLHKHNRQSMFHDRVVYRFADHDGYSKALSPMLKQWDESVEILPKDLRNTLQTFAIDNGFYDYFLQRYVGHAPKTVGERHYFADKGIRLVPEFRNRIVSRIDDEVSKWIPQEDSKLIKLFEDAPCISRAKMHKECTTEKIDLN